MLEALPGGLLSFVAIVLVFGLIVLVHEWGHMMAAKLCGVAVPDFAIGMGPSLWSRRWRGTRYHICAFPIGGYVQIKGLTGDDPLNKHSANEAVLPEESDGGRLTRRWQDINGWQKSFILVNGVVMNFVLALLVMIAQGFVGFPVNPSVVLNAIEDGTPAAEAGLRPGDIVLSVNGQAITQLSEFGKAVAEANGQPVAVHVRRGGTELTVSAAPRVKPGFNSDKPSLGVTLAPLSEMTNRISLVMPNSAASRLGIKRGERIVAVNGEPVSDGLFVYVALPAFDAELRPIDAEGRLIPAGGGTPVELTIEHPRRGQRTVSVPGDITAATLGLTFVPRLERLPPLQSVQRSLSDGQQMMLALLGSFKLLFTKAGADSVSGPIGIFSILGQSAQSDWHTFLMWVILININLGIMNLLPLPALDGGRLVFVALAGIGLKVPEKREALVHAAGMLLLLGFMVLISIRDISGLLGIGN